MNLVDESRGFKSRESRGWISWMDLVDSDLVIIIEGVSREWPHTLDRSRGRRSMFMWCLYVIFIFIFISILYIRRPLERSSVWERPESLIHLR